jgi:hypothetical protein
MNGANVKIYKCADAEGLMHKKCADDLHHLHIC